MQEYPSESDDGGSSEEEDTVCNFFGGEGMHYALLTVSFGFYINKFEICDSLDVQLGL